MKEFQEVAPPGWGHTKSDKEKGVEKGGSAAAFDRARKEGRFKGSKEDMFKLMWWMKNKGGKPKGKPHYKPGTDEKKKKYQKNEDWKPEIEVIDTKKEAKKREKKRKEAESSLPPHLRLDTMKKAFAHTNESVMPNVSSKDKGAIKKRAKNLFKKDIKGTVDGVNEASAVLDANTKIKDKEKKDKMRKELARLMKHAIDMKKNPHLANSYKPEGEVVQDSFEIHKTEHKKKQKERKMRNLSIDNPNKNEAEVAHKKAGGPKLAFEGWREKARDAMKRVAGKKKAPPKHEYPNRDAGAEARKKLTKKLKDAEHHKYVSFLDAPDD